MPLAPSLMLARLWTVSRLSLVHRLLLSTAREVLNSLVAPVFSAVAHLRRAPPAHIDPSGLVALGGAMATLVMCYYMPPVVAPWTCMQCLAMPLSIAEAMLLSRLLSPA